MATRTDDQAIELNQPMLLDRSDMDATARLLSEAFHDDAAYAYLFPNERERPAALRDFFRRNLATHLPFGCTFVRKQRGRVVATVTLRPPEGVRVSTLTMLRRGLVPFAIANGLDAVRRLLALKRTYDDLEREAARAQPHWHVHMMVVDPARQGQNIGSELLAEVLARATSAPGGRARHPVVLTTHKPRNVLFYERAGFKVVSERDIAIDAGSRPYRVWSMVRSSPAE